MVLNSNLPVPKKYNKSGEGRTLLEGHVVRGQGNKITLNWKITGLYYTQVRNSLLGGWWGIGTGYPKKFRCPIPGSLQS